MRDACIHRRVAVVGHRHGFGKSFGLVVNGARSNRTDAAPILLGLRRKFRVAVALAGRGQEKITLSSPATDPTRCWFPLSPPSSYRSQISDNQMDSPGTRNARHNDIIDESHHFNALRDIHTFYDKPRFVRQVTDIRLLAGYKIED